MTIVELQPMTKVEFLEHKSCRSCGDGNMQDILSLGKQHIVGFDNKENQPKIPLDLCVCEGCKLVQLRHTTDPSLLYTENYGYRSGINEMMRSELESITSNIESIIPLKEKDLVVDIGANDGTLLASYKENVMKVGFDPSRNMINHFLNTMISKNKNKYQLVSDYFSKWPFKRSYPNEKAKAVTAISMFYDLDNPNKFLKDVKAVLHEDGVFVIQQNYLAGMIKQLAFDNVCHEHLEYYSLTSMIPLLARNGFEVFDVEEREINGGSFRTYIRHVGSEVEREGGKDRISQMLESEANMGLLDIKTYQEFGKRVEENGSQLKKFIEKEVEGGKKIYVYGASTRGNTLLQAYGIDYKLIAGAAERNSEKIGKLYGSTGIPIVTEAEARREADYFLCLPWFLKKSFIERESEFLERGGKMIYPLPKFEIIQK